MRAHLDDGSGNHHQIPFDPPCRLTLRLGAVVQLGNVQARLDRYTMA